MNGEEFKIDNDYCIPINDRAENISNFYLKKKDDSYEILVLGRNGEPVKE